MTDSCVKINKTGTSKGEDVRLRRKNNLYLYVKGFKSLGHRVEVNVRPVTILAGRNSSGKSSFMQPFLLMKQTLNSMTETFGLELNGDHVGFSTLDELLTTCGDKESKDTITVGSYRSENGKTVGHVAFEFRADRKKRQFRTVKQTYAGSVLRSEMTSDEIDKELMESPSAASWIEEQFPANAPREFRIQRRKFFLGVRGVLKGIPTTDDHPFGRLDLSPGYPLVEELIHVPGLRRHRERTHRVTGLAASWPGTFDHYFAGVIRHWMSSSKGRRKLEVLERYLARLELGAGIRSSQVDDASLTVRLMDSIRKRDGKALAVNIADLGVGVSQVLPVLVALLVASANQIVYIEQPEIHLHPNAQFELGRIIAEISHASGALAVVETHSDYLIRGVQYAVVRKDIPADTVSLNWFARNSETGCTDVSAAEMASNGSFPEWPADFNDVNLRIEEMIFHELIAATKGEVPL